MIACASVTPAKYVGVFYSRRITCQYLKISFGNYEPKLWGRLCVTVRMNRGSGDAYVSPFRRTEALGTPMCHRSDEPKLWGRLCVAVQMNRSTGDAYMSPFRKTEAVGTPMCRRSDEPRLWGRLCVAVQTNRGSGDAYVSPFG